MMNNLGLSHTHGKTQLDDTLVQVIANQPMPKG